MIERDGREIREYIPQDFTGCFILHPKLYADVINDCKPAPFTALNAFLSHATNSIVPRKQNILCGTVHLIVSCIKS